MEKKSPKEKKKTLKKKTLLFNTAPDTLARWVSKEEKISDIQDGEEETKQYFLVTYLTLRNFKQTSKANNRVQLNCCMKGQYRKSIAFSHINNPIRLV